MKKLLLTLGLSAFYLIVLGQTGSLDLSFGTQGYVRTNFPENAPTAYVSSAIQADGKIVAIGTVGGDGFAIARYNTDGTLDNSFSEDGLTTAGFGFGSDVAIQPDGKIVVAGSFGRAIVMVRLNPDGSPDSSFSNIMGGPGRVVTDLGRMATFVVGVSVQGDGKIVVGGWEDVTFIPRVGTIEHMVVVRYNPDGALDTGFGFNGIIRSGFTDMERAGDMIIQPDGHIVMAGYTRPQALGAPASSFNIIVWRLNEGVVTTDISVDVAGAITVQPDGKLIVAGRAGASGLLLRYYSDGSLDNSFSGDGKLVLDPGVGPGFFSAVVVQPDGKIIAGGTTADNFVLMRFNCDGTPDNSFSGDGIVTTDFENGVDNLYDLQIWHNRVYAVGTSTINGVQTGIVAAFLISEDGAGMVACPGNRMTNVETGLCSAVINNIDPILNSPCALVDYILTGATVWSGTGSVSGFRFPAGLTTVTYRLTSDASQSCSFTLDIRDNEFPQSIYPSVQNFCFNSSNNYSLSLLQATDNCGIRSIEYEISGATTRSGGGNNASGFLSPGINQIKWTIKDISFNTTVITGVIQINPALTVTIPDAVSLGQGAKPNTVYIGYSPAAYITLQAEPNGGAGFYSTQWSDGFMATWNTVHPAVQTTYTVTVTDLAGCSASASKTVNVIDVRCGEQNNKVVVCKPDRNVVCIDFWTVADHLANGSTLGNCNEELLTRIFPSKSESENNSGILVYPNPSQHEFRISLRTGKTQLSELIIRDQIGRVVERIWIKSDQTVTVGSSYQPGFYFAEVIQGSSKFTRKLIKQ